MKAMNMQPINEIVDRVRRFPQRGQSLVEFAISLVILLLIIAGLVDAGRALFTYMALRDAAQEGALYGSTNPLDTPGIIARVEQSSNMSQDMSSDPDFDVEIIYVDANSSPSLQCMGDGITVRVSHRRFPLTMPFLGALLGRQWVPITATITDTILLPPCEP
jgi:hypothetical protein